MNRESVGASVEQYPDGWETQITLDDGGDPLILGPYDSAELAVYWAAREMARGLGLQDFDQEIVERLGPLFNLPTPIPEGSGEVCPGCGLALDEPNASEGGWDPEADECLSCGEKIGRLSP